MRIPRWITRSVLTGLGAGTILLISGCGDGTESLERGLVLLREGQTDEAVIVLEKAARRSPDSATAHGNLGLAYAELGNTARATASLRRAAELVPDDPRPLELLGQMFAYLKRWDEARSVLAEAQDRDRASARILTARGMVEFNAGQRALAEDFLNRALRVEPGYPTALFNMAQIFRQTPNGDATALAYLEDYLGSGPVDADHSARAREQMLDLRRKLAGPVTGPSPATPLIATARKAVEDQDFTRALISLKEAVRSDPAFADAHWELALLYDRYLDDPETAMGLYQRFATRFPGDERVAKALERQTALARPVRKALADVVGRAGKDVQRATAAYNAALSKHRAREWRAAADGYRQALAYDAQHVLSAVNLGQVLKADGDLDGAREALEYARSIKPDLPDSGYHLAQVYRAMGQRPEAELLAKTVASQHPEYVNVYYLLGLLARDAQNPEQARTHFQKYVDLAPADDPQALRIRQWLATE